MIPRSLKRIPRLFFGSTIGLVLVISILIAYHGVSNQQPSGVNNGNGRKNTAFFANAFSLPQQPAFSQQQKHLNNNGRRHRQPQQKRHTGFVRRSTDTTTTTTIPLFAAIPFYATDVGSDRNNNAEEKEASPAFLIETISSAPASGDAIYKLVANMCIDVFFKELLDPSGKGNVSLLKAWQINYLKNLQAADLERRRNRCPDTNEMFLAYEVRKTRSASEALSQPLLMDDELERAHNLNDAATTRTRTTTTRKSKFSGGDDEDGGSYVRGELLGFVEVTQRPYGLGGAATSAVADDPSGSDMQLQSQLVPTTLTNAVQMRPVLTNLAVLKDSRKYGIGSKLLDRCEEHVLEEWDMNEIILEVEDYNGKGLDFYSKRGYKVLFSDPASRRYDIQGFWLNKVRCRRDIMRKGLDQAPTNTLMKSADSLFRRIRDTVTSF